MKHVGPSKLTQTRRYWLKNWALTLMGLVAAQGGNALALILLARRVEPTTYGRYLASYALASLLVVVPGFGLDRWLLARGGSEPGGAGVLWSGAVRIRLVALGLWLAGMSAFAVLQNNDALPQSLLLLAAFGLAFENMTTLAYMAFRCEGRHGSVMAAQSIAALLLLGVAVVLPVAPDAVAKFAAGRMLIQLGLATVTIALLRTHFAARSQNANENHARHTTRAILRDALPFSISDIAISIYMRVDLTIVSLALGSAGAAVYGPALNLINVCFLVPFAFNILALPRLSRAYVASPQTFWRLGFVQLAAQVISGALISLGVWSLSGMLVNLTFGTRYSASIAILRLLSPLVILKGCSFGLGNMLTATDRQMQRTLIQVAIAVFNVLANLWAVNAYGLPGVAVVYMLSELLLCSSYALALRSVKAQRR